MSGSEDPGEECDTVTCVWFGFNSQNVYYSVI